VQLKRNLVGTLFGRLLRDRLMPEESSAPAQPATLKNNEQPVETPAGLAASSPLQGHVDYVDLAERAVLGIIVERESRKRPGTPRPHPTDVV
jgi:hypothetical protein